MTQASNISCYVLEYIYIYIQKVGEGLSDYEHMLALDASIPFHDRFLPSCFEVAIFLSLQCGMTILF